MTYHIIEYEGDLFAVWPGKTEDEDDIIERLPKGKPFLGVPWKELKPGLAIDVVSLASPTEPTGPNGGRPRSP